MAKKKEPEMKISAAKKKKVVAELAKAESLADVKAAVKGLKAAERNALAFEIAENIDRIIG